MTREQWHLIKQCARGENPNPTPVALIVDSPWIPGHLGLSTLDYLTVPEVWLEANLRIQQEFAAAIFIPGFWQEMGMGAEPSGFGCKVGFYPHQPPVVYPRLTAIEDTAGLEPPDPRTDGLMPVLLNFYRRLEPRVNDSGYGIKIVAARGPLTIAGHVLGVSELLLGLKLNPAATHRFLQITTTLTRTWLEAQAAALKEAEGILVLDDLAGFLSPKDYLEFAHPYLKAIFDAFPGEVKLFHNDTDNPVSYPHLRDLGIHIFNFTHLQPLAKVRELVGPDLCLMGNVPPLEVLGQGSPDLVRKTARDCLAALPDRKGLLLSVGGGVSPGTPGENIHALIAAARENH